jgi:hypothetical protein
MIRLRVLSTLVFAPITLGMISWTLCVRSEAGNFDKLRGGSAMVVSCPEVTCVSKVPGFAGLGAESCTEAGAACVSCATIGDNPRDDTYFGADMIGVCNGLDVGWTMDPLAKDCKGALADGVCALAAPPLSSTTPWGWTCVSLQARGQYCFPDGLPVPKRQ